MKEMSDGSCLLFRKSEPEFADGFMSSSDSSILVGILPERLSGNWDKDAAVKVARPDWLG